MGFGSGMGIRGREAAEGKVAGKVLRTGADR